MVELRSGVQTDESTDTETLDGSVTLTQAVQNETQSNENPSSNPFATTTPQPEEMATSIRLEIPAYSAGQQGGIKTWLRQVDVRLKLAKLTTEVEKYEFLIAALPPEILGQVYDMVNEQPETDPYTTLVKRIQDEFQPTDAEQVKKLLSGMRRGDKKPSLFLREMRELAKDKISETVLKELFLAQLPKSIAEVLEVVEARDLDSMAKGADRGVTRTGLEVAATGTVPRDATDPSSSSQTTSNPPVVFLMERMIEALERFSHRGDYSGRGRGRGRRDVTPARGDQNDRRQNRSRSRGRNPNWKLCRAHFRYGDNATRCESWCERWSGPKKKTEN